MAALPLAAMIPLLAQHWHLPLVLVFAQLPLYMLHQLEEHDDDQFRKFFNQTLGRGEELLTPMSVFVINVPGVWGVNLLSLYLAANCSLGMGMIGAYLTVVNALIHLIHGVAFRRYNPGLATAMFLFLPIGVWTIASLANSLINPWPWHALGIGSAIAIHLSIILYVTQRRKRLVNLDRQLEITGQLRHPV